MNKKDLKFYEAPACEVVELELQSILCSSGQQDTNTPGVTEEGEGDLL